MGKWALVKNGLVENIIRADEAFIDAHMRNKYTCIEFTTEFVGPGFTYENGEFIPPEEPTEPEALVMQSSSGLKEAIDRIQELGGGHILDELKEIEAALEKSKAEKNS